MSIVPAPVRPLRRPAPTPRPRPQAPGRHLRVVGPRERARRQVSPGLVAGAVVTVFLTLFLLAVAHTMLVQAQVRLDTLSDDLVVEQERYQELRREVAEMESPDRIVEAAQERGMVAPSDLKYLQPSTPDPVEAEPDPAGEVDTSAPADTWSTLKPLLEDTAP